MREEESKRQLMVIQSGNRHETQMPFVRIKKMKEVSSQGKRFAARQRPNRDQAIILHPMNCLSISLRLKDHLEKRKQMKEVKKEVQYKDQ